MELKPTHTETLADRVRTALEKTGLTQAEFAHQARIKLRTFQDVLGGQSTNPEMATLQGISEKSGVSIDELVFGVREANKGETHKKINPQLAQFLSQKSKKTQEKILKALRVLFP